MAGCICVVVFLNVGHVGNFFQITVHALIAQYRQEFSSTFCYIFILVKNRGNHRQRKNIIYDFVFWRFFLILSLLLLSFTKCSGDKSFTYLSATPVKKQKNRNIPYLLYSLNSKFFGESGFNLAYCQEFRITFPNLKR